MNREIKFRAWDNTQKTMVNQDTCFPFTLLTQYGLFRLDPHQVENNYQKINRAYVLMQFTGLKDKNGKECYHKDLLKGFGKLWLVEWQKEEARFWLAPSVGNSMNWKFMDEVSRMEIVGNIYENPELLTQ